MKKVVKSYIVENNIDTEKTVEHIIWECIQYASMKGMKFKSPASLGYSILPESINYWIKHEQAVAKKKAEEEEAARLEREANPTTEDLLKRILEEMQKKA